MLQTFHERLSRPQTLRRWSTLINQLGDVALNPDLADLGALAELYKALAEVTSDEEVIVDLPALVTLLNQIRPPGHLAGGGPGALTVATQQDSALLTVLAGANALVVRPPHDPARNAGDAVTFIEIYPCCGDPYRNSSVRRLTQNMNECRTLIERGKSRVNESRGGLHRC